MDNKFYSQTVNAMTKQMNYMKQNGCPGLYNDLSAIIETDTFLPWTQNSADLVSEDDLEYGMKFEEIVIPLPYAGTNFNIKMYFNLNEPWVPPDMIFSDQGFMKKISVKDLEDMVPSLNNWDHLAEDIIAQLLMQLHKLYKKYQLECLEEEDLLFYEYQSLLEGLGIGDDDVEISLSGGSGWLVSLMIRLPLNLKEIPPALCNSNTGTPSTLLHVSIKKSNGSFSPRLYLSPQVEALIGGSKVLGLPSVPPGSSLSDYITNVLRLLEDRLKETILSFEMRKQFIAQILCHFGSSLLEYDGEKFFEISLLFDWNDFNFILFIELPEGFPKVHPRMTLQSVYHGSNRGSFKREISELHLPLHPNPEDMVKAMKISVIKALPDFQSYTINNSK